MPIVRRASNTSLKSVKEKDEGKRAGLETRKDKAENCDGILGTEAALDEVLFDDAAAAAEPAAAAAAIAAAADSCGRR